MSITSSISDAKLAANRANAQLSTGPNTPEGRKASAVNSITHGLSASPETLFAAYPDEQPAYEFHAHKLRTDCQPSSSRQEDAFQRYAWATFQAKRARNIETLAQDRWLEDPEDPKRFSQMERIVKLATSQERRADKAMNELRKLQRDHFVIRKELAPQIAPDQTNPKRSVKFKPYKIYQSIKEEKYNAANQTIKSKQSNNSNEPNSRQYLLIGQHVRLANDTKISK